MTQSGATFVPDLNRLLNPLARGLKGLLGDIVLYNRILSSSERQEIERHLGNKWGISI